MPHAPADTVSDWSQQARTLARTSRRRASGLSSSALCGIVAAAAALVLGRTWAFAAVAAVPWEQSSVERTNWLAADGEQVTTPIALPAGTPCEPAWAPTFGWQPGVNGFVNALTRFDDGKGGGERLYVGGDFTAAGATSFQNVVAWDGETWTALGAGTNAQVHALAVFDDGYGGGPALYAGGEFTTAGGVTANRIAKWDGTQWSPLGTGPNQGLNGVVRALTVFDDGSGSGAALVVGGDFTTAGGAPVNRIARWDGQGWSPLGSGVSGTTSPSVRAMTVFDDRSGPALVACGAFTSAGGAPASFIARWNGRTWSALGSGLNNTGHALLVHDDGSGSGDSLYVGGAFSLAGGASANRIARWNGSQWSPLGVGLNLAVFSLCTFDDGNGPALYVGGSFGLAGGALASHVARWNGTSWSPLGPGVGGNVRALTTFDDGRGNRRGNGPVLFAGGAFTGSQNGPLNYVGRWDGVKWSPLGTGLSGSVRAIALHDDGLGGGTAVYAAGTFDVAGGGPARRIAKWDGAQWSPLAQGLNGTVYALTSFDDGRGGGPALIAGGDFVNSSPEFYRIAQWDGVAWSPVGEVVSRGTIYAFATIDGTDGRDGIGANGPALYVAGSFIHAGGIDANNVARWDGAQWTALGAGTQNVVTALAIFDDGLGGGPALYAGGYFVAAGGTPANRIAKWDGSQWTPLGVGLDGAVLALAAFDDGNGPALYAGGEFTMSGSTPTSRIARWDGSTWSAVGGGVNGIVYSLTVHDDGGGDGPALFAGGDFTSAGGAPANRLARWNGADWLTVGSGVNASVRALAPVDASVIEGPALIVGGLFGTTSFGDSYIGRWQACPIQLECAAADLDGDGAVGGSDLGILLGNWNAAGLGDITGDGVVDGRDLAVLLGCWG